MADRVAELSRQLSGGRALSPQEELLALIRSRPDLLGTPGSRLKGIKRSGYRNSLGYGGEKMNRQTERYEGYQARKAADLSRIQSLYDDPPIELVRQLMNNPNLIGEL